MCMICMHAMNFPFDKSTEFMSFAGKQMQLEIIIVRELSKLQKNKYIILSVFTVATFSIIIIGNQSRNKIVQCHRMNNRMEKKSWWVYSAYNIYPHKSFKKTIICILILILANLMTKHFNWNTLIFHDILMFHRTHLRGRRISLCSPGKPGT